MLTLIALVAAVIFLPSPWNWLLVLGAVVVDLTETGTMVWWSRRRRRGTRPAVGPEDLVGRSGIAATPLSPEGQIRVQGEIWAARSAHRVERGAPVVVRSVDGLVLDVEPVAAPPS